MELRHARTASSAFDRVVTWLALVAAAVGLTLVVRSQRDALSTFDWTIRWEIAALSASAFAVAPLLQGVSFWGALRAAGADARAADTLLVWSRSYVIRYAPTGALAIAYRVSARHRMHASVDQVLAAYAYEHVATLAAGAAACIALFAVAGGLPPLPALGVAVAALALTALLHPRLAGRAATRIAARFGWQISIVLDGRQLAALVAVNAVGWLATGTAVYTLVAAITDEPPRFLWLVASYTAGYLIGFVTPLAPGGLGVREGMLVVLLRGRYGTGTAAGISIAIRALNVAGELFAVALVHCAYAVVSVVRHRDMPRLAPVKAP